MMPLSRTATLISAFLLAFLFWVVAFAVAGRAGFPVRYVFSERLCSVGPYNLVNLYFEHAELKSVDYIVAGRPEFIEELRRRLPRDKSVLSAPLQLPSPHQYAQIANIFAEKKPNLFLFQNLPHFWTDYDQRLVERQQHDELWRLTQRPLFSVSVLSAAMDTMATNIELIATAPSSCDLGERHHVEYGSQIEEVVSRLDRFLWTSFLPNDLLTIRKTEFTAYLDQADDLDTYIWVFEPEDIPSDATPETREALLAFANRTRHVDGLGKFVRMNDVRRALKSASEPRP